MKYTISLRAVSFMALACAGLFASSCHREGAQPGMTVRGRKVIQERDHEFVVLDKAIRNKFSFQNAVQRRVEDDRLEVIVDLRNRTNYQQSVEASTAFRDADLVSLGDETAWSRLTFGPNETLTYRAISLDREAAFFTVRLREAF